MATKLEKPVVREVENWASPGEKDGKRPLMVTLNPAGFITFRLKGRQQEYDIDLSVVYHAAVKRWAEKKMIEDKKEREARRAGLA